MKRIDEIRLNGKWYQISYDEAYNGRIGHLFFIYTADKLDGHIFYTIQSLNSKDGFNYFIGTTDPFGATIITSGNYHHGKNIINPLAYFDSLVGKIKAKEMFDASLKAGSIPVRIHKYLYQNNEVTLQEVLIPLLDE